MTEEEKDEIQDALLKAIWIMRWTDEDKQSMYAVLKVDEAMEMVEEIHKELDKAGYKIVKK